MPRISHLDLISPVRVITTKRPEDFEEWDLAGRVMQIPKKHQRFKDLDNENFLVLTFGEDDQLRYNLFATEEGALKFAGREGVQGHCVHPKETKFIGGLIFKDDRSLNSVKYLTLRRDGIIATRTRPAEIGTAILDAYKLWSRQTPSEAPRCNWFRAVLNEARREYWLAYHNASENVGNRNNHGHYGNATVVENDNKNGNPTVVWNENRNGNPTVDDCNYSS